MNKSENRAEWAHGEIEPAFAVEVLCGYKLRRIAGCQGA
jgi:hypothetical protein